ncbi:Selenophosphate-dependent tRNA 2-selenouridine synthase [hydrothermal vent metagenome]|uniref:Selenophosphate-dependent tRNA 2-selenouridine synthase n=1 Tax=hydrothermal vent metagenome TaxID=652676 RepID=A0A3B0WGQ1_9ZZZZ
MDLPQINDYRSILLNDTPLLDVRAPIEFKQGAFPCAENFPLIKDKEREEIGICYKNKGQDEAIKLGHELVQGDMKLQRVQHWQNFFEQHPQAALYCFRGGMRSKISQQWLYEQTGTIYPRIKGGYKAMRRFLIDELETSANAIKPIMLGGRTGIGKTILLNKLKQQLDLEGIYHHRGSVFGKHVTPQPSQIDIENKLSITLLKFLNKKQSQIVIEDEGSNIGSRSIPDVLFNKMKKSPLILLEASVNERVDITFQEYIDESLAEHKKYNGDELGFNSWSEQLQTSIDKIQRRLGGERYKKFKALLTDAIQQQISTGDTYFHKEWIKSLLVDYYDPMYDFQTDKKMDRVVFKGSQNDVLCYLKENYKIS